MRCEILYLAFGDCSTATFDLPDCFMGGDYLKVAEQIYTATNTYEGPVWNRIEPNLPEDRYHTAISPGDVINIDGILVKCDPVGWSELHPDTWDWEPVR